MKTVIRRWNICRRKLKVKISGFFTDVHHMQSRFATAARRYVSSDRLVKYIIITIIISDLSDDRSTASSKTIPPRNAI